MLTRKQILAFVDTRIDTIDVPELGGEIGLARLTVSEADGLTSLGGAGSRSNVLIAIRCCCAADGTRLFTDADADVLAGFPADVMSRIAKAALLHNGLLDTSKEEAKNGSSEAPNDASVSD